MKELLPSKFFWENFGSFCSAMFFHGITRKVDSTSLDTERIRIKYYVLELHPSKIGSSPAIVKTWVGSVFLLLHKGCNIKLVHFLKTFECIILLWRDYLKSFISIWKITCASIFISIFPHVSFCLLILARDSEGYYSTPYFSRECHLYLSHADNFFRDKNSSYLYFKNKNFWYLATLSISSRKLLYF